MVKDLTQSKKKIYGVGVKNNPRFIRKTNHLNLWVKNCYVSVG